MSAWVIFLAMISVFYATCLNQKSRSAQYGKAIKQLEEAEKNEIKYDFNKFNTRKTANAEITIKNDIYLYQSDVKNIQVANETLGLSVQAKDKRTIAKARLFVKPFVSKLFNTESYRQFDVQGIVFFSDYYLELFKFLQEEVRNGEVSLTPADIFYWQFEEIIIDPNENRIVFNGTLSDGNKYSIRLNQKSFKLDLEAPASALEDKTNFPIYVTE